MTDHSAKTATVDSPGRGTRNVGGQPRTRAAIADPRAREVLRKADPVLRRIIDAREDFRPRAWMDELPPLDAFGTLIFQVAGQQLSVRATRTILSRLEQPFGGRLPTAAELLAADAPVLRQSGLSLRKAATIRSIAERFVDGRLSDEALIRMTDQEVVAALTEIPGIGPWSANGFLLVALDRLPPGCPLPFTRIVPGDNPEARYDVARAEDLLCRGGRRRGRVPRGTRPVDDGNRADHT